MNSRNSHEHMLHENPHLAELRSYLELNRPTRLEQLNEIDMALIASGLAEIEARYGELSDVPKAYHNYIHTRDALYDYCVYADALELDAVSFADGALAITYHDWEQDLGSGANEEASMVELGGRMEQTGYTTERIAHAQKCVHVTDVEFDSNGLPDPKNLMTYAPDRTLLAVSLADMNGITLRGETSMVDCAYRLVREVHHLSYDRIRDNPREFVTMLAKQFFYVGDVLTRLEPAVHHHVQDFEKAEAILALLEVHHHEESSMAINAAKTVYELIQRSPSDAVEQLMRWGAQCTDESQYVAGIQRFVTRLALGRRATHADD